MNDNEWACTYKINALNDWEEDALLWVLFRWISGHDGIP